METEGQETGHQALHDQVAKRRYLVAQQLFNCPVEDLHNAKCPSRTRCAAAPA
ncbi:hypothetical protein LMG29660_05343 [Burkholderia puraquae]|uniref:Uncharacterized protein n=1 Tax=Burkholderia puraquae TaxID=1904757 RepID=A0A6J5EKG8_9BURK|nr:hypothetical protein LMG29660_05343 [Burkholderia puraquae]